MNKIIVYNFLRFFILVFVQVVLLKNITMYNLNIPFLYILFIFLLPFKTPKFFLFFLSFTIGLGVDVFSNTLGLHAAACTLIAFLRILYISITVQNESQETIITPNLSTMGFRWFFIYTLLLTFTHHFCLYLFEVFDVNTAFNLFSKVLLTTTLTLFLVFITELLFYKKQGNG
ncbi:MAG: rod shape-determining protein MreD [Sphingobacteriales bacterium]|nr:MAG: rod shape-determining protein MreD [Sphingobacteriales bacterium]TAF80977.1 MAG: rod shape-determining protein MreD [Sphingobacteriales bacterium]